MGPGFARVRGLFLCGRRHGPAEKTGIPRHTGGTVPEVDTREPLRALGNRSQKVANRQISADCTARGPRKKVSYAARSWAARFRILY
jgi:hypothetical protein